jgi:hypothetical protein
VPKRCERAVRADAVRHRELSEREGDGGRKRCDLRGKYRSRLPRRRRLAAEIADFLATPAPAVEQNMEAISPRPEDLFDRFKPSEMSSEESDCVKALLRRMLQFEPDRCPQAPDLQKDAWFTSPGGEFVLKM